MNGTVLMLKKTVGSVYRGTQEAFKTWHNRIRTRYAYYYKHCKLRSDVVLYESFYGRGMLCNPYAIFLELLDDPRYAHLQHVWVLEKPEEENLLISRYKNRKNVTFVKFQSKQYVKYLCTAKYLVNNSTFPNYYIKKPGQVYINTWHGIPLKTMGFDIPDGAFESTNVIRNFLQADYLLAANSSMTDMYQKAYRLKHLYQGKILEEGYPRLDLLTKCSREQVFESFRQHGVQADINKKVILFAPTWRGESYAKASTNVDYCFDFKERLEACIDTSEYQILVKVHQRVYELAKNKLTEGYFVPSKMDVNEIMSVTDILVSDFSSVYFDFLATGKPILFYIPDLENYTRDRGLYKTPDCLPGPCTTSVEEIGDWVNHIDDVAARSREKYSAEQAWSNGYGAGSIAAKIVDVVFAGNEADYKIHRPELSKKRILISKGKTQVNGMSTSLLSLLNQIDYSKFDVSVMVCNTRNVAERNLVNRINPNARVLVRSSSNPITIGERIIQTYYERTYYKNPLRNMFARDARRSYGDVEFDYFIDFDGYSPYYAALGLQYPNARKCIWQHNDMMAEKNDKYAWLDKTFRLYAYFDRIVSCAYDVMLVNRENMSGIYCDAEKFTYMKNFIDINRIKGSLSQDLIRQFQDRKYILASEKVQNGCIQATLLPYLPEYDQDGNRQYRFVTIGRFSMEKNHENLINAFSRLQKEYGNVCLYMLGDGKLKKRIDSLVARLNLGDHVFAPGNIDNPFSVLENADCFILPSLHEGQPMVINEARALGMPIIVSNFSSVNSILLENGQLVIETDEDSIYEGMKKYIQGQVPCDYEFDPETYNAQAYQEFLNVLEG